MVLFNEVEKGMFAYGVTGKNHGIVGFVKKNPGTLRVGIKLPPGSQVNYAIWNVCLAYAEDVPDELLQSAAYRSFIAEQSQDDFRNRASFHGMPQPVRWQDVWHSPRIVSPRQETAPLVTKMRSQSQIDDLMTMVRDLLVLSRKTAERVRVLEAAQSATSVGGTPNHNDGELHVVEDQYSMSAAMDVSHQ